MPSSIIELRVGKIQQTHPRNTAIDKHKVSLSTVDAMGLETDEQAESFHGGIERAILQFDPCHYLALAKLYPQSAHLFINGGFGENFVVNGMNEHNVCIGDIFSVGGLLLQVTQPRVPCYKLNKRFQVAQLARYAQNNFITGWFYKVLQTGIVKINDTFELIERPNPQWSVAKVMYYLFIKTNNQSVMKELIALESLGMEIKNTLQQRLKTGIVECWHNRLDYDA